MENGVEKRELFTEEELREISGLKRGDDYVEVMCGCTSHRYGDAVATLRVFSSGELEIACDCTPGCDEGLVVKGLTFDAEFYFLCLERLRFAEPILQNKLTPAAFEKHSGRETARKWKNNIWIIVNGEKVPVVKTPLLKYYNQLSKHANGSNRSQNGKVCHRDEFLRCTECNKERRFRLRSTEECRIYHDALANVHWMCSCIPYDKVSCDDEEERASRRVYRGCSRSPTCKGCTTCVCFGCEICRFSDCSCQTCSDFTRNAKA